MLFFRDSDGAARGTLHQGHLSWTSRGGWHLGIENEPLVWGYGVTGGYLLGEAARPFPRLQVTTPPGHPSLFGISLGTWTGQTFLGRLEARRRLADNVQNPSAQSRLLAQGEPEAPFFSGYRLEGRFYEGRVETYINWTALWGGSRNGVPMTHGYGFTDYLTAMTGTKDLLAESSTDFTDPAHPEVTYKNQARSSTNFDFGVRGQVAPLARWLEADQAWIYVSRGTKGMLWPIGVFAKRPIYWLGKDLKLMSGHILRSEYHAIWFEGNLHIAPNLLVPNDAFGVMVKWPQVRIGVERRSTSNIAEYPYRSFENNVYAAGFYRDGDPLGEALGGETDITSFRVEWDPRPDLTTTCWLYRGARPFRDDLALWHEDHPGAVVTNDLLTGFQFELEWKYSSKQMLRAGGSLEHHRAVGFMDGQSGTGRRWFLDWSVRWSKGASH